MEEIGVSIHCLTYNHEKYVRKTFDGFLAQKTNFAFEVLVHDDASSDSTQSIIREYTEKYPEIFKPIYQTENQCSKGIKVSNVYNFPRAKGKYIAYCEGDDYWCDENKLQRQYEAMEQHQECSMCVHIAQIVSADESKKLGTIPVQPWKDGVIDEEDYLKAMLITGWASQTSSFFVRTKYLKEYVEEKPMFSQQMQVGDLPVMLYMITKGKVYFIDEVMSCYRFAGNGSFRSKEKEEPLFAMKHLFLTIVAIDEYNKYTEGKYESIIRTYMLIKLEAMKEGRKRLLKMYEPYYLEVIYAGRDKSFRIRVSWFIRKYFPHLYRMLLWFYRKLKELK